MHRPITRYSLGCASLLFPCNVGRLQSLALGYMFQGIEVEWSIMDRRNLPFEVGQDAEARSFLSGYRGAWFRCKIREIGKRKGELAFAVEYIDFPDEKVGWTKLYQKPSKCKDAKLMIRPRFPLFYHEGQVPDISSVSEVVVIVNNAWKEGDLVDWWSDDCFWSGRLVKVLGNDKFKFELFPPPLGEGKSYDVSGKDLRPSLDWSPEHSWTLPIPAEGKDPYSCARLVKPGNQGGLANLMLLTVDEGIKDHSASLSSHISSSHSLPSDRLEKMAKRPLSTTACMEAQQLETNRHLNAMDSGISRTNCSDSVSTLQAGNASAEVSGNAGNKDSHQSDPSKKMRTDRSIYLNTMSSDTIEAAILDLEELVNRVKWIKDILQFGMPLPNPVKPSWEFFEHRASSLQK